MKQSISELKRYRVCNRRGDKLGVIDDVVLDADDELRRARGIDREAPPARPDPLFRSPES
jgi:sporulation protein YlmC with PRC-barrel domain